MLLDQQPFGLTTLRTNGPSDQRPFGPTALRTNDPSDQQPFGPTIASQEWGFFELELGSKLGGLKDFSRKKKVAKSFYRQKRTGPVNFDRSLITLAWVVQYLLVFVLSRLFWQIDLDAYAIEKQGTPYFATPSQGRQFHVSARARNFEQEGSQGR